MKDKEELELLDEIKLEWLNAVELHGPIRSKHEGYGLILEELDEFWDLVRMRIAKPEDMRAELVQVAAMCIRAILDLDLKKEPHEEDAVRVRGAAAPRRPKRR